MSAFWALWGWVISNRQPSLPRQSREGGREVGVGNAVRGGHQLGRQLTGQVLEGSGRVPSQDGGHGWMCSPGVGATDEVDDIPRLVGAVRRAPARDRRQPSRTAVEKAAAPPVATGARRRFGGGLAGATSLALPCNGILGSFECRWRLGAAPWLVVDVDGFACRGGLANGVTAYLVSPCRERPRLTVRLVT